MTMHFHIPDITWPKDAAEAIVVQKELRGRVRTENEFEKLEVIAGIDCSYDTKNDLSRAVIVVMRVDDLQPIEVVEAKLPTEFPYIPGLLSFREIPVILATLKLLKHQPDVLMVDGQGIAHPRRLGIAAHLGALLDFPAVGVAKSRLCGKYQEPGPEKFDASLLLDKEEQIGTVLRSKVKTKPLFISPGHRMDQGTAIKLTCDCLRVHRLPEPTRIADKISKQKTAELPLSPDVGEI